MDRGEDMDRVAVLRVTAVEELVMKGMGVFEPVT